MPVTPSLSPLIQATPTPSPTSAPHPNTTPTLVFPGYSHFILRPSRLFHDAFSFRTHTKPSPKHHPRDEVPQTYLPLALHRLQCSMDVPASAPSSSRRRHFLDRS